VHETFRVETETKTETLQVAETLPRCLVKSCMHHNKRHARVHLQVLIGLSKSNKNELRTKANWSVWDVYWLRRTAARTKRLDQRDEIAPDRDETLVRLEMASRPHPCVWWVVLSAYLRRKWIDLQENQNDLSPFCTHYQMHFIPWYTAATFSPNRLTT